MARRPAGAQYPHVTTERREADHSMCPVLAAVLARVEAKRETWGTPHSLGPVDSEAAAKEAVRALYRARNHTGLKRGGCGTRALSIKAVAERTSARKWIITLQVWDRKLAKQEIARRVRDGEELAYNVLRRK